MLSPAPNHTHTGFVRPEYVNLEVNRIASPGPVPHPDKNFRPYGTNNWHVILHDHTRLRHLSNSEIKGIRDHVGELTTFLLSQHPGGAQNDNNKQPRLIEGGPYNTDDATQVWKYCHAYLGRRGQMRNNNAARRSRMKKESETRYWKLLALQAGVPDHEYEFTAAEELAAFARAEEEKTEKEQHQQQQAAASEQRHGSQDNPRKRRAISTASGGGGRGQKAAKRSSTASGGLPMYPPLDQQILCGGYQYHQGYAPAPVVAYEQGSPVEQPQGPVQPQHRFNTRARARAEQSTYAAPAANNAVYDDFPGANAMTGYYTFGLTTGAFQPPTVSPSDLQLQPDDDDHAAPGEAGEAGAQADGRAGQETSDNWMDAYLTIP